MAIGKVYLNLEPLGDDNPSCRGTGELRRTLVTTKVVAGIKAVQDRQGVLVLEEREQFELAMRLLGTLSLGWLTDNKEEIRRRMERLLKVLLA